MGLRNKQRGGRAAAGRAGRAGGEGRPEVAEEFRQRSKLILSLFGNHHTNYYTRQISAPTVCKSGTDIGKALINVREINEHSY